MNKLQQLWLHKVETIDASDGMYLEKIPKEAITYELLVAAIEKASECDPSYAEGEERSMDRAMGLAEKAFKYKLINEQQMENLCLHVLDCGSLIHYIPKKYWNHKLCVYAVEQRGVNYLALPTNETTNPEIIAAVNFRFMSAGDEDKVWAHMPHDAHTSMVALKNGLNPRLITIDMDDPLGKSFWIRAIKINKQVYAGIKDRATPLLTRIYEMRWED